MVSYLQQEYATKGGKGEREEQEPSKSLLSKFFDEVDIECYALITGRIVRKQTTFSMADRKEDAREEIKRHHKVECCNTAML